MFNLEKIKANLERKKPLIHCITNPISINSCANVILSLFARPIMAEHPREVEEITCSSDALLLNLGSITDARIVSMKISAKAAKRQKIPIVFDAVGVAASTLRRDFSKELFKEVSPTLIKGNYSEIEALYNSKYNTQGVDGDKQITLTQASLSATSLAKRTGCIVLASGETDIVTDGKNLIHIKNGVSKMSRITGTGCMLGAVCSTFLSMQSDIFAVVAASAYFGICGELSAHTSGTGSFSASLLDNIGLLSSEDFEKYKRIEVVSFEEI